ncbi:MAG: hypothetical protein Kapaf2KO_05800 [Candidatus Kapaibacteriales bacterium]
MEYIGTFSKSKGFRGELLLKDVQVGIETIEKGSIVKVGFSEKFSQSIKLEYFKSKKSATVLKLSGYNNENETFQLIGKAAFTDRSNINKKVNSHITEDIIGVEIFDNGDNIGTIVDVVYTQSSEIWTIEKNDGGEFSLPNVDEFVLSLDLNNKKAEVRLPEGLLEL